MAGKKPTPAFDPDAFLAEGTAAPKPAPSFDPDAFLADGVAPERPDALISPRTGRVLTGPQDRDPVDVQSVIRGADGPNGVSHGDALAMSALEWMFPGGNRSAHLLAGAAGAGLPPGGLRSPQPIERDPRAQEKLEAGRAMYPKSTAAVGLPVALLGLAGMAGGAVTKGIGATSALGRIGAGAAGGAVGGALEGGASELARSNRIGDVAKGGAVGGVGGAVGGAVVGAAAEGLRKLFGGIAGFVGDTRRSTGKYARALDRAKSLPGDDGQPANYLKSDEFKGLSKGITGIGEAADMQGEQLGKVHMANIEAADAKLRAREAEIPNMDQFVDVKPLHEAVDGAVRRYHQGRPVRPDVADLVQDIKKNLSNDVYQKLTPIREGEVKTDIRPTYGPRPDIVMRRQALPPSSVDHIGPRDTVASHMSTMDGLPTGFEPDPAQNVNRVVGFAPGEVTQGAIAPKRDVLAQRRAIRKQMGHPGPLTPENAPYREIYGDVSEATHEAIPRLRPIDADYEADMKHLARGAELIWGQDSGHATVDGEAAKRVAASKLTQALKETQAGGANLRLLERIRDLGPEYAGPVDRVAGVVADRSTRFGMPNTFGHSAKWMYQFPIQQANALAVRGVLPVARAGEKVAGAAGEALARTGAGARVSGAEGRNLFQALAQAARDAEEKRKREEAFKGAGGRRSP